MIRIGIDIGSTVTKAVVMKDENIIVHQRVPTGWSPKETGNRLMETLKRNHSFDESEIASVVTTGYGRKTLPFATRKVTEITCHAKGAFHLYPSSRTVIDIGGQDSKVIRMDDAGNVIDFMMNDKCAAGTGQFLHVMATRLEVDVNDLEKMALLDEPVQINSMCTVFAESEIIGMMAAGASKESIASGLLNSVAGRISTQAQRIGIEETVFFSGGLAINQYLQQAIQEKLNKRVEVSPMAQYTGAIGAALLG
ncbi:acyl-CoA dehydratase activase [Tindallia californiensis]|uniref:Benzoyl-CoA reductase, bcr type, subunit D n=1 Tax=Tindallia californiensis TaxID=159292 RepID=A0A1H3Q4G2_9FIRM|nr:acyl-CoA dehydratase activase [Tindallia californiensis]SDZ08071.1 benzoyl-CoA reductase, bcr type, subunit D [Tindallia californiensis]